MEIRQSDTHRTILGAPLCGPELRQLAFDFIKRNEAAGRLRPIDEWEGDLVTGYADILGLQEEWEADLGREARKVVAQRRRDDY